MYKIVIATSYHSSILDYLCCSSPIRVVGIIDFQKSNTLHSYAAQSNICYHQFIGFNQLEEWLSTTSVDLLITYKVPYLLPETIYNLPPMGSINIHPSLLPHYKGLNPWFGIYYNMELYSGVTIHRLDLLPDHGDILAQDYISITLGSILDQLQREVEQKAITLLDETLKNWPTIVPIPQPKHGQYLDCKKLINSNLIHLEGIHLWHILRGFPWLLKTVCKHPITFNYSIEDFLYSPNSSNEKMIGYLVEKEEKLNLICKNGMVEVIKRSSNTTQQKENN